jgi:hypothetical protein
MHELAYGLSVGLVERNPFFEYTLEDVLILADVMAGYGVRTLGWRERTYRYSLPPSHTDHGRKEQESYLEVDGWRRLLHLLGERVAQRVRQSGLDHGVVQVQAVPRLQCQILGEPPGRVDTQSMFSRTL